MPKYIISGTDINTGKVRQRKITAREEMGAIHRAEKIGIKVSNIELSPIESATHSQIEYANLIEKTPS